MKTLSGVWITVEVHCQFCGEVWSRRAPAGPSINLRIPFETEGWTVIDNAPRCAKHDTDILAPTTPLIVLARG